MNKLIVTIAFISAPNTMAQLPAFESFSETPLLSPVGYTGSNSTGWANSAWAGSIDPRLSVVDHNPNLTHNISGGGLVNGGNRALSVSTGIKPLEGKKAIFRTIQSQNTKFYFSFLVHPTNAGTGADQLEIGLLSGSNLLGRVSFSPNEQQNALIMSIPRDNSGSYGTSFGGYTLDLFKTYFIVIEVSRPKVGEISFRCWRNPSYTYSTNGIGTTTKSISSPNDLNTISFAASSADSGGNPTTAIFDELKIGFTWIDVLRDPNPPEIIPNILIEPAVNLSWPTITGKIYQVQYSYNLNNWVNYGSPIGGDGTNKSVFAPAHENADSEGKKFYRVRID